MNPTLDVAISDSQVEKIFHAVFASGRTELSAEDLTLLQALERAGHFARSLQDLLAVGGGKISVHLSNPRVS